MYATSLDYQVMFHPSNVSLFFIPQLLFTNSITAALHNHRFLFQGFFNSVW